MRVVHPLQGGVLRFRRRMRRHGSLPAKAEVDALRSAISATNGTDYLLTWNCTHIANRSPRRTIEDVFLAATKRSLGVRTSR